MPRLYILCGCNGAGKTTASYSLLPELLDCREFVNSDEFAKSLSPFDPSTASVSASRYMIRRIQYLLSQNADFSIETTLATRTLVSILKEAREKGYTITLLYLWVQSPDI
ncbi:MAG: AAA family ATPase, partial [Bacteroidales bacterium]|nr:AAA family ATPase [Bacteroidales bacterium]